MARFLVLAALGAVAAMIVLYFVVKAAVRDGINESDLANGAGSRRGVNVPDQGE